MLHTFRRSVLTGAAAAAALAVGLAATAPAAFAETVLKVVPHSGLKILDPIWTTAYITRNHGYMIYDTLFTLDTSGEIQPQMVDSVTRSDDGLTVTITLRDGLKWHDGADVTAEDTVASINRWASKDAMGQKMMTFVDSLEATDAKTMTFKLNAATSLIELALAKPSSNVPFMMPARIAATPGGEQIEEYIGSGPFMFNNEEWEPGTKVVYEKFDGYVPRSEPTDGFAGAKEAKVDRVEWTPIRDMQQAVNALIAGEIDLIESVPPDLLPILEKSGETYTQIPNEAGLQYTFRLWKGPSHCAR
jgi:peptide/nickel transport system substrate-binding protein